MDPKAYTIGFRAQGDIVPGSGPEIALVECLEFGWGGGGGLEFRVLCLYCWV